MTARQRWKALRTPASQLLSARQAEAEGERPLKLWYFKGRGKAEMIRFALGGAGVKWQDCFVRNRADMVQLLDSGKLLFGQVPMLEFPDGRCLVQTMAILKYVGEAYGLHGETARERAEVNMLVEGTGDFLGGLIGLPFEAAQSGGKPVQGLQKLVAHHLPRYCGAFETHLASRPAGETAWMVGARLTVADTSVLRCVEECVEWLGQECLEPYPCLTEWRKAVLDHPQVRDFLAGPQRQPGAAAPGIAGPYCQEVGDALGWR